MRSRFVRELQERAEEERDVALARARRAANALHDRVAGLLLLREAVDAFVEEVQVGLGPVGEKGGAEPVDRRPVDAEVGVPPFVLVAGVALPLVGDPDAAGERDRLVDDEHLAVGPVVEPARASAGRSGGTTGWRRRPPPSPR